MDFMYATYSGFWDQAWQRDWKEGRKEKLSQST